MHTLELKIPPAVLWAGFVAAVMVLAAAFPAANMPFPGHRLVSVALFLAGVGIAVTGVLAFRRAGTTVNPMTPQSSRFIVTTGIYRYTRNPMYLGMAAALAGTAVWKVSLPGLLLVPVFLAYLSRFQIIPEERALSTAFGDAYVGYLARVRRWL